MTSKLLPLLIVALSIPLLAQQLPNWGVVTKGKVIYREDFSSPNALDKWTKPSGKGSIKDGVLYVEHMGGSIKFLLPESVRGKNVAIQADIAIDRAVEVSRWISLLARQKPDKSRNFTHIPLRQNLGTEITDGVVDANGKFTWQIYVTSSVSDKKKATDFRTCRLELRDHLAKLFVDGKLICSAFVSPDGVREGLCGILIDRLAARVDNIVVEELSGLSQVEIDHFKVLEVSLPFVVAHRGFSSVYPENTLEAVQAAIDIGADAVEIDARISKDGVVYCLHDGTLDRTTDGTGPARDKTMAELKALDAGSFKDKKFKGAKIPTFEEVLLLCKGKVPVLIDLKEGNAANAICDIVLKHDAIGDVILSCGGGKVASIYRERLPGCTMIKITGGIKPSVNQTEYYKSMKKEGFDAVFCMFQKPLVFDILEARKHGLSLYVWTINDAYNMIQAWKLGADAIITDRPDLAIKTLNSIREKIWNW